MTAAVWILPTALSIRKHCSATLFSICHVTKVPEVNVMWKQRTILHLWVFIFFCKFCQVCVIDTFRILANLMQFEVEWAVWNVPLMCQIAHVKRVVWKWGQKPHSAHSPWEIHISQWAENRKLVLKFVNKARKWPLSFVRVTVVATKIKTPSGNFYFSLVNTD